MRSDEKNPGRPALERRYGALFRCLSVLASTVAVALAAQVHGARYPVSMAVDLSGVDCPAFDRPLESTHSAAAANGEELLDAVAGSNDLSDAVADYLAAGGAMPEPLELHRRSHGYLRGLELARGGDFAEAVARIYGRMIAHGSSPALERIVQELIVPDLEGLGTGGRTQRCAVAIATVGQDLLDRVGAVAPDPMETDLAVSAYEEAVALIMGLGSRCARSDMAIALGKFSSVIPALVEETDAVKRAALEAAADAVVDDLMAFEGYSQKYAATAFALVGKSLVQTFLTVPGSGTDPTKSAIFAAYADRRAELVALRTYDSGDLGTALAVLGGAALEGMARIPDLEGAIREVVALIVADLRTLPPVQSADFAIGLGVMGHQALMGVARQPAAVNRIRALVNSIAREFAGFPGGEQVSVGWSIGCAAGAAAEGVARQPEAHAALRSAYNLLASRIMGRKIPRKVDDAGQGLSLLGISAIEGIARQPEAEKKIRRLMDLAAEDLRSLPRGYQKHVGLAVGYMAGAFAEGTARQPEAFGKMQQAYEQLVGHVFSLRLNRRNDDIVHGVGVAGAALIEGAARNSGAASKLGTVAETALADLGRLDGRRGFWRFFGTQKNGALGVSLAGAAWLEGAQRSSAVPDQLELLYRGIVAEITRRGRSFLSFAGFSSDLGEAVGILGRTSIRTSGGSFGDAAAQAEVFRITEAVQEDIRSLRFD